MTRRARQALLTVIAVLFTVALAVVLANRDLLEDPVPPRDPVPMARWIAEHPADWVTASALSGVALDSDMPRRFELWRAAHALARHVAPRMLRPPGTMVRGGLFHWYELTAADRGIVLREAAPLLRDPGVFHNMHRPLWELTHDFAYLRRNAPDDLSSLDALRTLAISNGLFAEYRELRAAIERKRLAMFESVRSTAAPPELLRFLPGSIKAGDEPLVRGILGELHRRSFEPGDFPSTTPLLIEYALSHDLRPLDGFAPFVDMPQRLSGPLRARLALALGNPDAASRTELASEVTGAREWIPYHLERALFEARRGDAAAADLHLRRASISGIDLATLAAAEQTATILGNEKAASQFRAKLAERSRQQLEWRGSCGPDELCTTARAFVYVTGGAFALGTATTQSDQTPPYVEVYVDDQRVAEGEVRDTRRFEIPAANGLREVEVRLLNRTMANGAQRRVRLSRSVTATAAPAIAARVAGFDGMKKLKSTSA